MFGICPTNMSEITASNLTDSSSKKRQKSVIWEHFTVSEEDKSKAICSHCPKHRNELSCVNYDTKNLFSHLNSKHKAILNAAEKDPKQPRIDFMLNNPPVVFSQDDLLIKWVVLNDQPLTEVESTPLKEMLTLLKPLCLS